MKSRPKNPSDNLNSDRALEAIESAFRAIQSGNHLEARRWAERAATLAPEREEPWLILAGLASPKASLAYLNQALEINPLSKDARKGMHWAVQRWRKQELDSVQSQKIVEIKVPPEEWIIKRSAILPWALIIFIIVAGLAFWFGTPSFSLAFQSSNTRAINSLALQKATFTPTNTATYTPTPTFTPTQTPTHTPTLTPSVTPSPSPTLTATTPPTKTPIPTKPENSNPGVSPPSAIQPGERWIDVNLSTQRVFAYQGKKLKNSFVVSTGTWRYPTVTGQYHIYVKYLYADMSGPGYYLLDVPYVMYFYKGYGIHGTYWHNNFGTPMSHGCINLTINDAGWMFNWASVGTLVNIHY
ncbi:MAG: L,D-transpeptidase family protein [Anaerolineales bacterium]|jgi:lipoprotein-anchoring transpeptidase ErfK/SrfK